MSKHYEYAIDNNDRTPYTLSEIRIIAMFAELSEGDPAFRRNLKELAEIFPPLGPVIASHGENSVGRRWEDFRTRMYPLSRVRGPEPLEPTDGFSQDCGTVMRTLGWNSPETWVHPYRNLGE